MGSIIELDSQPGRGMDSYTASCRRSFAASSTEELVEILNHEVGCEGWVSARAVFLVTLREELCSRGVDLSEVDHLACFPGRRHYRFVDDALRYTDYRDLPDVKNCSESTRPAQ